MDQKIIGAFIAERRRTRGLTQRELADKLNISDKTVSKWERGSGLPEISLMLPLCEELHISVNELLSGRTLGESEYKKKAEDNILDLYHEKARVKRLFIAYSIVAMTCTLAGAVLLVCGGVIELPTAYRLLFMIFGGIIMAVAIFCAVVMDLSLGAFSCQNCGHCFVPTASAYIWGMHTLTKRNLRCPKCGKKSWCKRVLTEREDLGLGKNENKE